MLFMLVFWCRTWNCDACLFGSALCVWSSLVSFVLVAFVAIMIELVLVSLWFKDLFSKVVQCLGPSEGAAELAVVYEDIFLIVESWFLSYISLSLPLR